MARAITPARTAAACGDVWLNRQRKQRKDRATVPARNATDNVNMKKKRMRNKQREQREIIDGSYGL